MLSQKSYRRPLRLPSFDYGAAGGYYVTICAWQKESRFGEVTVGAVQLSAAGHEVLAAWESLPARLPQVRLDAFVIMPNHVHGILWLTDEPVGAGQAPPLQGSYGPPWDR